VQRITKEVIEHDGSKEAGPAECLRPAASLVETSLPDMYRRTLLGLVASLGLVACRTPAVTDTVSTGSAPAMARVTGTVSYRERMAVLPGVVIKVQLLDVSRVDASASVVGEQIIKVDGRQVPLPFDIPYDTSKILPRNTYAVRAWLEDPEGRMRFTTDQRYAVITQGAPTHVDLVMKGVGTGGLSPRP
jgi:putative lipoprotein